MLGSSTAARLGGSLRAESISVLVIASLYYVEEAWYIYLLEIRSHCQAATKLSLHGWSLPVVALNSYEKRISSNLELLLDPDMLLMIEKRIRGGVSIITTRYGIANNPYSRNIYDPNSKLTHEIHHLSMQTICSIGHCANHSKFEWHGST